MNFDGVYTKTDDNISVDNSSNEAKKEQNVVN